MSLTELARNPNLSLGRDLGEDCGKSAVQPLWRYRRSWAGITAEVTEVHGPGPHLESLRSDKPRLVVMLEEVGGCTEMLLAPDRPSKPSHRVPRALALFSAGTAVWARAERFRYIRRMTIDFDTSAIDACDGDKSEFRFPPRLMFCDLRVCGLADLLAEECAQPHTTNQSYGDCLALAIFYILFRSVGAEPGEPKPCRLTPRQLRRVTEYLEQCWSKSVQLKDIANVAGLSQAYFSRAFKASTGLSPLRWHLTVRIQRAQQILLEKNDPLADIALATGFADQSHFTRAFRTIVGESPSAWRRNHKT